jgi:hypothetical protein
MLLWDSVLTSNIAVHKSNALSNQIPGIMHQPIPGADVSSGRGCLGIRPSVQVLQLPFSKILEA